MNIEQTDSFIASLGFEAYRVGGSVRDELVGRDPKDADYMVRGVSLSSLGTHLVYVLSAWATPSAKAVELKLRDGTLVGFHVGKPYNIDIVLPRREEPREPRPGEPAHHAFNIVVDPDISLDEDAKRRDFTFNALYKPIAYRGEEPWPFDPSVQDPTGRGLYDLERKIINTTHERSFVDDPVRMLRALRFVARGYTLGGNTQYQMALQSRFATGLIHHYDAVPGWTAMTMDGHRVSNALEARTSMSGTVYSEMCNILMGDFPAEALRIAAATGVLGTLFPELAPMIGFEQGSRYHDLTCDEHTFKAIETAGHVGASLTVRWALLFHDAGKPETAWTGPDGRRHYYAQEPTDAVIDSFDGHLNLDHEEQGVYLWTCAAERLSGVPKELAKDVSTIIQHHMIPFKSRGIGVRVRRMRVQFGDDLLRDLLMHRLCDLAGKDGKADRKHMEQVIEMETFRRTAREVNIPASVKDLKINGHDVEMAGGMGYIIGGVLRGVLDEVVVRADGLAMERDWQLARMGALLEASMRA